MRKVKIHLIAVYVIAIVSGFITTQIAGDPVVKVGPNTFMPINLGLQNLAVPGGWTCIVSSVDTCTYYTKPGVPSGKSSYTRAEVDPYLPSAGLKFQWIIPPAP